MTLFSKLSSAQGVRMLCGATLTVDNAAGSRRRFGFRTASPNGQVLPAHYVLLAVHYYSNILSRYPRDQSRTYVLSSDLHWMVHLIVEQGVWPDSDLFRYAGVADSAELVTGIELNGPAIGAALIRPLLGEDLDIGIEIPPGLPDEDVNLSVIAMMQGVLALLDERGLMLMDHVLRKVRLYHNEGADYSDPAIAARLVNRAFREASDDGN